MMSVFLNENHYKEYKKLKNSFPEHLQHKKMLPVFFIAAAHVKLKELLPHYIKTTGFDFQELFLKENLDISTKVLAYVAAALYDSNKYDLSVNQLKELNSNDLQIALAVIQFSFGVPSIEEEHLYPVDLQTHSIIIEKREDSFS